MSAPTWAEDLVEDLELYAELDTEAAERAAAQGSPLERVHRRHAAAMAEAAARYRARFGVTTPPRAELAHA